MSVRIMSAVFDSETLGPTERLIMLALADHADDEGKCYPSIARLCRRTGLKERAVQNNLRSLSDQGYLAIIAGGGRNNCNLYIVSAKPRIKCTPHEMPPASDDTETPHLVTENPAADAPKPSRTTIEPSVSVPACEKPADILGQVASRAASLSFIAFRSKIKKPLTDTAARRVAKSLHIIANQGGDADDALGMAEERGWQSIKPDWYFKETRNAQPPRQDRAGSGVHSSDRQIAFAARAVRSPNPDCI